MSTFSYNYPGLKVDTNISYNPTVVGVTNQNILTVPSGMIAIISYLKLSRSFGSGTPRLLINGVEIAQVTTTPYERQNLIIGPGSTINVNIPDAFTNAVITMFGVQLKNADV